jgi:methyl-accepting chemotaxis protein
MKKRSSLERKMLSYFGLIAAASLLITIEFVYAIQAATPRPASGISSAISQAAQEAKIVASLDRLRNKAMLLFVVQAAVTLVVLVMFMRRITGPLQHMVEISGAISEGDVSRVIRVRSRDEIGLLGETINGLASNIQELASLGLSNARSIGDSVSRLRDELGDSTNARPALDEIERKLAAYEGMMLEFKLFPAPDAEDNSQEAA